MAQFFASLVFMAALVASVGVIWMMLKAKGHAIGAALAGRSLKAAALEQNHPPRSVNFDNFAAPRRRGDGARPAPISRRGLLLRAAA